MRSGRHTEQERCVLIDEQIVEMSISDDEDDPIFAKGTTIGGLQ